MLAMRTDGCVNGGAVRQRRGIEQKEIRHIGQQAAVQLLVIRHAADGAEPDLPGGGCGAG